MAKGAEVPRAQKIGGEAHLRSLLLPALESRDTIAFSWVLSDDHSSPHPARLPDSSTQMVLVKPNQNLIVETMCDGRYCPPGRVWNLLAGVRR